MNRHEKGYMLIELVISMTVMALASVAAGGAIFQILSSIERNNAMVTSANHLTYAGYYIGRDVQMAENIVINNALPASFLTMDWFDEDTSYTVVYSFENEENNVGSLIRTLAVNDVISEQKQVANHIYFNPDDTGTTTSAGYQHPVFSVNLTIQHKRIQETREYLVRRRIDDVNQ